MPMLPEKEKYRAYTFNISGFALMAPFGKIVLEPTLTFKEFGPYGLIFYGTFCVFLFLFGLVLITKGYDILGR